MRSMEVRYLTAKKNIQKNLEHTVITVYILQPGLWAEAITPLDSKICSDGKTWCFLCK